VLGVTWRLDHANFPAGAGADEIVGLSPLLSEPDVVGGLITTHKAAAFEFIRDDFDLIEPMCGDLAEIGVAYKRGDLLCGGVSDVDSGGYALARVLDCPQWEGGCRAAWVLGAGGAGLAVAWNLAVREVGGASSVVLVESSPSRLIRVQELVSRWPSKIEIEIRAAHDESDPGHASLGQGALIINATGLGKDRPGSPMGADEVFPQGGIIWDFNYRGSLEFLRLAEMQRDERGLTVFDGFDYFSCGWSVVMSRVAGVIWTPELFERFREIAGSASLGAN